MKRGKKLMTLILAVATILNMSAGSVLAADAGNDNSLKKEPYTYTVTFYAGKQGTFAGTAGLSTSNNAAIISPSSDGSEMKVSGLKLGDTVSFNAQANVSMDATSKYYVQGVRLSGRDNDTVAASAFRVEGDADYVVAYGIKGNVTSYTVNYYKEDGSTLVASETFYGNVGDKPVVAYKYVDGYRPQALGLTKTLSENGAENVFTFVYEEVEPPVVEETVIVQRPEQGTTGSQSTTGPGSQTGTGGTADGQGTGEAGTGEDGQGTGEAGQAGTDGQGTGEAGQEGEGGQGAGEAGQEGEGGQGAGEAGQEGEDGQGTIDNQEDILDLDDEETPLSEMKLDEEEVAKGLPLAGIIIIALAAAIALAGVIVVARKKK